MQDKIDEQDLIDLGFVRNHVKKNWFEYINDDYLFRYVYKIKDEDECRIIFDKRQFGLLRYKVFGPSLTTIKKLMSIYVK